MEELFSGYQAVTPQFKVVQTDKNGRVCLDNPTSKTGRAADGNCAEKSSFRRKSGPRQRRAADPREERTVFVGNLPPSVTRRRLKQLFGRQGKVESVRLRSMIVEKGRLPVRVAKRKQLQISSSTINSYVVFAEEEGARRALELNGVSLGDRHIRVDMATGGKEHVHERSVFVGGLPYSIDDEEFRDAFEKFGEVESVRVIREPKMGAGKGFGFVTFRERSGVMFALQSSRKTEVKGQRLRIMKSKDTTRQIPRPSSVARFSGTQANLVTKTIGKRRKIGGTRGDDVAKKRSTTQTKQGDKDLGELKKADASELGLRPSRTFHKKKEARQREREERKREPQRKTDKLKNRHRQSRVKKLDSNS